MVLMSGLDDSFDAPSCMLWLNHPTDGLHQKAVCAQMAAGQQLAQLYDCTGRQPTHNNDRRRDVCAIPKEQMLMLLFKVHGMSLE